ncbi:MAG TPA: hypothetical protein VLA12_07250 [Planctomycetaceae bacterium]|nr:hypothetical protein [Planctomycetaceae bacterium]
MKLNTNQATLAAIPEEPAQVVVHRRPLEFWSKSTIACLTAMQISRMNNSSLFEVVEQVQHYLPQAIVRSRLQSCDRVTLVRLAYLARRICRNQGY